MAIIKPDLTRIWAAGAPGGNIEDPEVTVPGKFDQGWVAEVPPFENFNFLQQLFTQGAAYINENGLGEWDTDTNYQVDSLCRGSNGLFYRSLTVDNAGNDPIADAVNWEQLNFLAEWNTNITYAINDIVIQNGTFYKSLTAANTGNSPAGDIVNWKSSEATITDISAFSNSLTKLIHPDQSKGLAELQSQGVYPISFNQQWGGMGYGGLPDGSKGEIATGIIDSDSTATFGAAAANTHISQGFKVGKTTDIQSVWVKLYKVGSPTNNLQLFIYDDSASTPNAVIVNGTATSQNGKIHSNNTDGGWVKFTFAIAPNLTGGAQYHIVMKSSGAVDASNYWSWKMTTQQTYPHGSQNLGDGTPTWAPSTDKSQVFLIEPVTTILQSGLSGFNGALHGYEGSTLNQSGAFVAKNSFMNSKHGMIHLAGTGWDADKTFFDSGLGADNNRIVIRCLTASGFAQVDLYETDGTKHTVTGTTDITAGNNIVSVGYRSENDGADFLKLYINGTSEGVEITAASILLSDTFGNGHSIIGGGFPLAPVWTQDLDMSALPSAAGWTWTGVATEANAMVVDGGILYQNGAGYASTDTGYYLKATTLNNATGWIIETKVKIKKSPNTLATGQTRLQIKDGSKTIILDFKEYVIELYDAAHVGFIQHDLSNDSMIKVVGKGSDFYIFINNELAFDGTGLLTTITASNDIRFGDTSSGAGENATAEWSYLKYFEGIYLPEYSTLQLSEFAYWDTDKSTLLDSIYNGGSIQSVKALSGMNENFIERVLFSKEVQGTAAVTTSSTTAVPMDDMQIFSFGDKVDFKFQCQFANSANATAFRAAVNGNIPFNYGLQIDTETAAKQNLAALTGLKKTQGYSLNFTSISWFRETANPTANNRTLTVEG